MASCPTCEGDGICQGCLGSGDLTIGSDIEECLQCEGSGDCPDCEGSGEGSGEDSG